MLESIASGGDAATLFDHSMVTVRVSQVFVGHTL